ncbi:hypothetical protein P1X14_07965 [Sphingomonas sp. AOB5]|uniref:hypothetical protein n=1 Tax=Sphingomonas sp. AOB5 TaxID=3034017 RepID=UPI0023F86ED7|nr:hypothetical protein [Sphingomonas sp. AOB5]MDF7775179.1 hypothetical protein [Sphingomonas sp. AOB5]
MKTSPTRIAILSGLLGCAAITALMPAVAQDTPESLLPPGFDNPAPAPAPPPTRPADSAPRPAATTTTTESVPGDAPAGNSTAAEGPAAPVDLSRYEMPDYAKRTLDRVGVVASGNQPFPANAFGRTDGKALMILMHRLDAPVASRWISIALRRALQSPIDTPQGVNGADYAAERAWLLLRMGESNAARAVIQEVDTENYTPMLYRIALQSSLASADPGMVCPIADTAAEMLPERGWKMAQAWCAGLGGQPSKAQQLLSRARGGTDQGSIDNLLGEKVAGAGGRSAVTIEWDAVTQLNSWRWGLATATGEAVPDRLYATVGPQVRYWQALAPTLSAQARLRSAELAAAQGVFSNAGLVSLYSEIEAEEEASSASVAAARDLRTAYTGADAAARIAALKTLWNGPESQRERYARLILTARAATKIPANAELAEDADQLVASMLSAGLVEPSLNWRGVVAKGGYGWMLLELADPAAAVMRSADFDSYRGSASRRHSQLALAALAGLGKMSESDVRRYAQALEVQVGGVNSWTRAIDRAAQAGDPGTVALLAAVGMQSRSWAAVTPEALFHVVAAFRAAGMPDYARMIAIEAITRA